MEFIFRGSHSTYDYFYNDVSWVMIGALVVFVIMLITAVFKLSRAMWNESEESKYNRYGVEKGTHPGILDTRAIYLDFFLGVHG